ncbi:hypothetical protein SLEP1_g34195 [Rubroshorea leprosula]|uniref:Uncharacterized protein n=1 Tax=Rubroshorea leprosula TaxID=152421 RepID=A0AAV5KJ32_9ROSI|nr:hypothetical protein SLEP1_g34195 [Rubroshorea leprosula]
MMSFLKLHGYGGCNTNGKRSSPFPFTKQRTRFLQSKQQRKKRAKKKIEKNMKRLKKEMEEISEEQKSIWEGQRQVRQKFEAMEEECKQLREETKLITMQSRSTQLRLFLMFQILKDRENNDLVRATELTRCLREMISAQQNKQIRS